MQPCLWNFQLEKSIKASSKIAPVSIPDSAILYQQIMWQCVGVWTTQSAVFFTSKMAYKILPTSLSNIFLITGKSRAYWYHITIQSIRN